MTADELRKAEARYQRAFARSEELREARNLLVRQALADGWTHARIAEATGLTRGRVGQIAQASRHQRSNSSTPASS
jgi:CRP-like cAMP-binding protein